MIFIRNTCEYLSVNSIGMNANQKYETRVKPKGYIEY